MYFSKDADTVPTFEFPGSTGAGPRQGSSVHGILQAGMLDYVALGEKEIPDPRIEPRSQTLLFEPPGKPTNVH